MKTLLSFLVVMLVILFHTSTAIPAINCGSGNVLELESVEINEVVILEESILAQDPCQDKYVCKLSCDKLKINGVKNCHHSQHFDLTGLIQPNTNTENYNTLGVVGYSFKPTQKYPELELVAFTGFYNGRNHFYVTKPPKGSTNKVINSYNKKIKKYFEENQLGFLVSPTTKPEIIKKYETKFNLKPLYFHYEINKVYCRVGRYGRSMSVKMVDISNSKKSPMIYTCPDNKKQNVGKSLFLGYIASKSTEETIPVTKYSYKEGNPNDKFLGSSFAKSSLETLKGFFADTYVRVCSADRSQEKTDEVMDVLFRDFVTDFYKVDPKEFVFKKKEVNTGNGNHLHSIQYLNWAYNLNKKQLDKVQKVKDLEMFQKLYGYILGLRQFIAICNEQKYDNNELSRKLAQYEKQDEFIKYSVIGTSQKFKQLATTSVASNFKKMFTQTRRTFIDSIKTRQRGKYCECSNFVRDKKFRETAQGKLFKQQMNRHCQAKCIKPKEKKQKKKAKKKIAPKPKKASKPKKVSNSRFVTRR